LYELILKGLYVFAALLFLQIPTFIQQYTHELSGHVAELTLQISAIEKAAQSGGKTTAEYIHKFAANSDQDFSSQGLLMQNMLARFKKLSYSLSSLSAASPLMKPWVFANQVDLQIMQNTASKFQVGITLSFEGLLYAFSGLVVAGMLSSCFAFLGRSLFKKVS